MWHEHLFTSGFLFASSLVALAIIAVMQKRKCVRVKSHTQETYE